MATKSDKIAALILGAAATIALIRFFKMPKEEREEFFEHLKERTNLLLENTEATVDKVNHFISEYDSKGENEWVDKLYILKNMFKTLYGSDKHFLL